MNRASLRRYQTHLARTLGRFSASSERFGPPHGICHSLEGWCRNRQVEFKHVLPHKASPAKDAEVSGEQCQHRLFAAILPHARVFGKASIAVLTDDDQVLDEVSVAGFRGRIEEHRIFRQFLLPRVHQLDGRAAVLAVPGGNTYYHWLLDLVPRLEIIRLAGWPLESIRYFIVNGDQRPFQRETLDRLDLIGRTVSLEERPHLKASELIVPSFSGPREKAPRWACEFLRKIFLSPSPRGLQAPRRIYISRARAKSRLVTNERDVTSLLERLGFQAVQLEELKVADQAALFSNAEWIIGTHGSAFANLVFCSAGAKVLEVFSPVLIKDMYEYLARQAGLNYRSLVCQTKSADKRDPKAVTVNLCALEEAVAAMS